MAYFVFQVADQSAYGKQRSAEEVFNFLVKERSVWGFGPYTPNRKAIQAGDKVLFYLTGAENQVFVGSATLKSGAYEDTSGESAGWYLSPETLRIDLEEVVVFPKPRHRKDFLSLEWRPAQGGSSKISERDYLLVIGAQADVLPQSVSAEGSSTFLLEKYLEEVMVGNWEKINFDEPLKIYVDENGNPGRQYYTEEVGYIDILAQNAEGTFVVIELKKGRSGDEVVGQVLRYMQWVRRNLCTQGQSVKGLIVVGERDIKLEHSVAEVSDRVGLKLYKTTFQLETYM